MALGSHFLFVIVVLQIFCFDLAVASAGPKLNISTNDYILKTGENLTVLCEGNGQLKWKVEEFKDHGKYSKYTTIQIVNSTAQSEGFTTALELRITNATTPCVGMYYCMNEEDDSIGPALLYIYVYDAKYLAATNVMFDQTKIIKQGDEVTIPCIPTAPDVQVTLEKKIEDQQSQTIELGTNAEGNYYKFSQLGGFTTNDTSQIQLMTYKCDFKRGNLSVSYEVEVDVEPETHSISEPSIDVVHPKLRNLVGETITLKCSVKSHVRVEITWIFPGGPEDPERLNSPEFVQRDSETPEVVYGTLTIRNTSMEDSRIYTCQVRDYQDHQNQNTINITIFEHFYIDLIDHGCSIEKKREIQNTTCSVEVNVHPLPKITWLNNKNESIPVGTNQYVQEINSTNLVAWLKIVNVTTADVGIFTFIAVNEYDNRNLTILVDVIKKPTLELKLGEEYQMEGYEILVECIVTSYPKPIVELMYKPCLDDSCGYAKLEEFDYYETQYNLTANMTLLFENSGVIKCVASENVIDDSEGHIYEKEIGLFISDVENGFGVESLNGVYPDNYNFVILTIENSLEIICSACIQNFTQRIQWKRDSKKLTSDEKYKISTTSSNFSNSSILNISDINIDDKGFYTCELYKVTGDNEELMETQDIALAVSSYVAPVLLKSNLNSTIEITDGSYLELMCVFSGKPPPIITWYKNDDILTSSTARSISENGQKLTFSSITKEDEGLFECQGKNSWGIRKKETKLIFNYNSGFKLYGIIIGILTLLVIIASVTTLINHFNKKKLEKLLEEAGLTNFEEGQLDNLNPELGIADQVDCLPYDRSYEFPFNKLKLGKILGSGAFGVVVLGEARGISSHEKITAVAVKMVERNAQQVHIKALVAELKILIHLGKHVNVINLLGACTRNIAKRELLVIEEYCRYGNLQTFLYRRRNNFVFQLNPSTESKDFGVEEEIPFSNYSSWLNDTKCTSTDSAGIIDEQTCSASSQKNMNEDEDKKLEDNLVENERRSESISTADLLSWSFQVARGMEYLVSRRVLHGDLAARNILLADENVVKICDFGLAKRTYQMEIYKKTSDGPLPVKWMAIESIRDRIFSSQSDVWSFGIVLWELFSLAKIPYPGMEADEKLFAKLENGYRMESPKYSNPTIYQIMLDCWSANPLNRPTFTQLSERLGLMLEDSVRTLYIRLNDPYLIMNTNRMESRKNDYLTMVSPPSFQQFSSPQNDMIETITSSGYVQMTAQPLLQKKESNECCVNVKSEDSASLNENIHFPHN